MRSDRGTEKSAAFPNSNWEMGERKIIPDIRTGLTITLARESLNSLQTINNLADRAFFLQQRGTSLLALSVRHNGGSLWSVNRHVRFGDFLIERG